MGNFIWYKTKAREELLEKAKKIPEVGKKGLSDILEMALAEFVKKHGESMNPQTKMNLYLNPHALAVPNAYASDEEWIKFFELLKNNKTDFSEFDKQLSMINRLNTTYAQMYGLRL